MGQRSFYPAIRGQVDTRLRYGVNLANGNLVLQAADFSMPGIGLPVTIGRTYNSQFEGSIDAGQGWVMDSGADVALDVFHDGAPGYRACGYGVGFTKNAGGLCQNFTGGAFSPPKSTNPVTRLPSRLPLRRQVLPLCRQAA